MSPYIAHSIFSKARNMGRKVMAAVRKLFKKS